MNDMKSASTPADAGDGALGAQASGGDSAAGSGSVRKIPLAIAAVLFGSVGLAVFFLTRPTDPPDDTDPGAEPVAVPAALAPAEPLVFDLPDKIRSAPIEEALPLADQMLLVGDLEASAAAYADLQSRTSGILQERITYRIGVVDELLGHLDDAQRTYQSLLDGSRTANILHAAQLGLTRVAVAAKRFGAAQLQLGGELLRARGPSQQRDQRLPEATHLFAQCLAGAYLSGSPADLLIDTSIVVMPLPKQPIEFLRLCDEPLADGEPLADDDPGETDDEPRVAVVHRFGQDPEKTQVDVNLIGIPLMEAVSRLAGDSGLRAVVSEAASRLAMHREVTIRQSNTSLAAILDRLLIPMGMSWQQADSLLHVWSLDELDSSRAELYQQDAALRALRHALIVYPEYYLARTADAQLGMIHFRRGDVDQAIQLYTRFLQHNPRSPLRREVWFNLAKAYLLTGEEIPAIEAFYRVIDNGSQDEIADTSYLYIGRLHFELEQYDQATRPLLMAISSLDARIQSRAAVVLASCYALNENFSTATSVLAKHGRNIKELDVRMVAELVSQYARFRSANANTIQQAGAMLVSSLARESADPFLQNPAALVRSHAYRVLGLFKPRAAFLAQALKQINAGAARQRIVLALVESLVDLGELEDADRQIEQSLPSLRDPWLSRARLKQVDVAYLQSDTGRCLELCANLVGDHKEYDVRTFALKTMGRIYHSRGEFEKAALCFAGMIPAAIPNNVLRSSDARSQWRAAD